MFDVSGITPPYFPALHDKEPRNRTDNNPSFYFEAFMV